MWPTLQNLFLWSFYWCRLSSVWFVFPCSALSWRPLLFIPNTQLFLCLFQTNPAHCCWKHKRQFLCTRAVFLEKNTTRHQMKMLPWSTEFMFYHLHVNVAAHHSKTKQIIAFYLDGLHSIIGFKCEKFPIIPTSTSLASDAANETWPYPLLLTHICLALSLPSLSSFPILWWSSCLFVMWHVNEKSSAIARLLAALVDPWPHFIDMRHSHKSHVCMHSAHHIIVKKHRE